MLVKSEVVAARFLRFLAISDLAVILVIRDTPMKSSPLDVVPIEMLKG